MRQSSIERSELALCRPLKVHRVYQVHRRNLARTSAPSLLLSYEHHANGSTAITTWLDSPRASLAKQRLAVMVSLAAEVLLAFYRLHSTTQHLFTRAAYLVSKTLRSSNLLVVEPLGK